MKKNTKYIWIVIIIILFFSTRVTAQQGTHSAPNKQAKTEIEGEQKREKEKESIEEKRAKKSLNKISDMPKYKGSRKRRKKIKEKQMDSRL